MRRHVALIALALAALCAAAAAPGAHAAGYRGLSVDGTHACAIRADDDAIVCWGSNGFGESTPPAGRYAAVYAGGLHTCATRLLDRTARCWGWNAAYYERFLPTGPVASIANGVFFICWLSGDGRAGCSDKGPTCDICEDGVPLSETPPGSFTAVTAGYDHACAIRAADGTLACWGDDAFGEASPPPGAFVAVSAGYDFTCGVRADRALVCWGWDMDGRAPPPGSFATVSAGVQHACALRTDGSLACWGPDVFGETDPPQGSFREIASGNHVSCAVRADGSLTCWGGNASGVADPPGEPPKLPPTTTIALSPPAPDGANGWYVTPVHATVSASANVPRAQVLETVCTLGSGPAPDSFWDFPSGCPYLGTGLDVSADGAHVLAAASRDTAQNVEQPVSVRFLIDRTPPLVRCDASPAELWPRNGKLVPVTAEVTVDDATSGPAGFALVAIDDDRPYGAAGGRPHDGDVQGWAIGTADVAGLLRARTRGDAVRRYTLRYRGFDRAGNASDCDATVIVPSSRGRSARPAAPA